jgi:Flp pilus assembly protein TadD
LSLVTLAKLQLDRGNAAAALRSFNRYLGGPGRPLEAEALVGRATALRRLGRGGEEAMAWRAIAEKYPDSAYAEQANERLAALSGP